MLKLIVFIFLLIFNVNSFNIITNECNNNYTNKIAKTYFQFINCLSIIRLSDELPIFTYFEIPTIIKRINPINLKPNFDMKIKPRRDYFDKNRIINNLCAESDHGYLIIANDLQDILNYAYSESLTAFWSPQSRLFIYLIKYDCNSIDKMFFENLWHIYKNPQIILSGCNCKILFYNPYLMDNANWGKLLIYSEQEVLKNSNLIINKMKNFNKYPIKAMVFKSPFSVPVSKTEFVGIDINLLKVIADTANLTAVVVLPTDDEQYGFKLPNGTYTGALGKLLIGEIDYINVNFFIKDYLTIDIEFSASVTADNLCLIMRKAERIPDWQLLYFCLDKLTWIAIIIIYFVVALSWMIIEKLLTYFMDDAIVYPFIFTDTFRLMITSSLFRLPHITTERVFLAWLLMAFVTLVGAFQGSLIGVYTTPMFYKDIDTLEQLSKTDTQIKSEYMFFIEDVFSDETYPVIAKLKSMISFYDDPVSITYRVANQKNFATLVRKSEVQIDSHTTTYLDENGINLIHMVRECPRSYNLAYPFPINSALLPELNRIILISAQAGLLVRWYNEMAFNSSRVTEGGHSLSEAVKVFALTDMQISFFQLLIGSLIGFLIFLIEIFTYLCKKNKFPEYNKY